MPVAYNPSTLKVVYLHIYGKLSSRILLSAVCHSKGRLKFRLTANVKWTDSTYEWNWSIKPNNMATQVIAS